MQVIYLRGAPPPALRGGGLDGVYEEKKDIRKNSEQKERKKREFT